jgi:hypothetical protein
MKSYSLIKQCLLNDQDIEISDMHAKAMLEVFPELESEIDGLPYDTVSREYVTEALTRLVFKDAPPPENENICHNKVWDWPCNGSSNEYKREFYTTFNKLSKKIGIKLPSYFLRNSK